MALGWHNHLAPVGSPSLSIPRTLSNENWREEEEEEDLVTFDKTFQGASVIEFLGVVIDLLLNLAALGTEASDRRASPARLALCRRDEVSKALGGLGLQLVGQIMEDACTILHRLHEGHGQGESSSKSIGLIFRFHFLNWTTELDDILIDSAAPGHTREFPSWVTKVSSYLSSYPFRE